MSSDSTSQRKWRVLVLGHSVTRVVTDRTSRLVGPYPDLVEQLLRADGYDVEVRNEGTEFTHIGQGIQRFQEVSWSFNPDVVIANFGVVESQAPFIPQGVYNHFQTWDVGTTKLSRIYRGRIAPRLWVALRKTQRRAVKLMGNHFHRMPEDKFVMLIKQLVRLVRHEHRLLLMLDMNPPGPRISYSLPGSEQRIEEYNAILTKTVLDAQAADPDGIRLIPSSAVVADLGFEKGLPDGYHFSAEGHKRIAEMLVAEIEAWIGRQQA